MSYKIKGIPLLVLLVLYCATICFAAESIRLEPDEVRAAERTCRQGLRRLASAQLAYADANRYKEYGIWWYLTDSGYIDEGKSRKNFIENYSLAVFYAERPQIIFGESDYSSTFTVVAIPSKYENQLRTFAIDDNRIPLVWAGPDGELKKQLRSGRVIGLDDPGEWDPRGVDRKSRIKAEREKKKEEWEDKCKLTLRALGSCQLAYMDSNLKKDFGSWYSLAKNDYIMQGYTRSNIIDNYSIAMFQAMLSSWKSDKRVSNSSFTIVAVPRSQKWGLRTFGISDDQVPRMWVGGQWNLHAYLRDPSRRIDMSNDEWQPLR